jgi:hypothetical protein
MAILCALVILLLAQAPEPSSFDRVDGAFSTSCPTRHR